MQVVDEKSLVDSDEGDGRTKVESAVEDGRVQAEGWVDDRRVQAESRWWEGTDGWWHRQLEETQSEVGAGVWRSQIGSVVANGRSQVRDGVGDGGHR